MMSSLTCRSMIGRSFVLLATGMLVAGVGCSGPPAPTEQSDLSGLRDSSDSSAATSVSGGVLTLEIAEQFLANDNSVDLSEFTKIQEAAAESLSKYQAALSLRCLTELSDAAAESLSKHQGGLDLSGLIVWQDGPIFLEHLRARFSK